MAKLILLRHGQSQWNLENRFTGWVDVPLSDAGREEARRAGERLKGLGIDKVYTSKLTRAKDTAKIALEAAGLSDLPITEDEALNERHYGDLQGLNKAETAAKYGEEQVHIWRRSFDVPPPGVEGESLEMCMNRVYPYFQHHILKDLVEGTDVLVVAHGNSLRSLLYHLDKMTRESIMDVNIPTGVPIVYEVEPGEDGIHVVSKKELTFPEAGAAAEAGSPEVASEIPGKK